MSEWKKVKIGDFLTEREGRFKPEDKAIAHYKRLDKIDFLGTIHLSTKPTKTDMILVYPGDLVISGINVAKGAITVYQGKEPVCATIHYSSYTFNSALVDLDYFKYFVKSPAFVEALKQQVKGGIKTEIKPKHLLPLEISIPNLPEQKRIVSEISENLNKIGYLTVEIDSQKSYIKQLRQNILQDAIEGKLTADWRKDHPVIKGDPNYDAEALFEQIQKERNAEKKQKKLAPITDEEKPFEIPDGWKWVRLKQIVDVRDGTHDTPSYTKTGYPLITGKDFYYGYFKLDKTQYISKNDYENISKRSLVEIGDILFSMIGGNIGSMIQITKENYFDMAIKNVALFKGNKKGLINQKWFYFFIKCNAKNFQKNARGGAQPFVSLNYLRDFICVLPPLAEQKEIAAQVAKHLQTVFDLENQIAERENIAKQLMQSILKDAFGVK